MNFNAFRAALLAAFLSCFASFAQSAIIEQVETDLTNPVVFNPFDPSLGSLTAVNLLVDVSATFAAVDPAQLCSVFLDCEGTINLSLVFAGGTLDGTGASTSMNILNSEVDAGFDETLNLIVGFGLFNLTDFLAPNVIGTATVSAFATGDLQDGIGDFLLSDIGDPIGSLTLRYTFNAVPAPGTIALFAFGLFALGLAARGRARI